MKQRRVDLDASTRARAERMERKIRTHYAIGVEVAGLENPDINGLAESFQVTSHTLRRFRLFARLYKRADLEKLCKLRRPNGLPLQWGHVNYLLTGKDRQRRDALQTLAAKQDWTAPMLHAAIRGDRQAVKSHGRKMARPTSAVVGMRQLVAEGETWLRRLDVVLGVVQPEDVAERDDEYKETIALSVGLMKRMREKLRDAMNVLSR
ncbi:MAG: hypothetical protein IT428_08400 [Planctomycetaceae bacterium]|nr:hypothetical protein [Planctomycetaceae bacterium]